MARFLVDEDLPRSLAPFLTAAGLFAEDVRDRGLRGQPDDDVFRDAVAHGFAVLSGDLGFGNLMRFPLATHHGIVVARLSERLAGRRRQPGDPVRAARAH
jgi:predicted nuclease of predicted toxin-antitoxin system